MRAVANDRDGVKALCIGQGHSHALAKRLLTVIRNTCDEAVKAGRLNSHRLAGLKPNGTPGVREFYLADPDQISAIADAMGTDGLAVRIMAGTGVRIAECLALRTSSQG